jgi:hypothetical protein
MEDASIRKFFARHGRYRAPTGTFYHRQLRERLTEIGFKVLSIERLDSHPLWRIRLKGSLGVQAHLLISQPAGLFDLSKSHGLLERQLTKYIQRILKQLGQPVRKDEVVVVRSGVYVHVAFVWPLGTPGVVARSRKEIHPFQVSLILRRWLREKRN